MAEARILVDQEQFICPVCLDLLKNPVTVPCGHSYCKECINDCWDQEDKKRVYSCPQCRQTFTPRPVLHRNNMLAEVVEKLKKTEVIQAGGAADVECSCCTGTKHKAIKSCLTCLSSYCETHIQPHYQSGSFKKHKLVEPSSKLEENVCPQHDEELKIYCRTDQSLICYLCTMHEHKDHDTVSALAERDDKQGDLKEMRRKCQQKLQEKQMKVEEVKQTVNNFKRSAQMAVEDSERIFTELINSVMKTCSEVRKLIRDQENTEVSRAERALERLEQEIADLKRRDAELEQLSHTEDHIHFLQCFQSLSDSFGSEDSSSISVHKHPSFDGVKKSVSDLKERLEEFNKISPHAAAGLVMSPSEPHSREDFLKYFCYLTLDPNTVHHNLKLSEMNKVVTHSVREQCYSDHPDRFDNYPEVLCEESVCGRSYWEVEWSSKRWSVYISVSYKGISRKGEGDECVFGGNSQSWTLRCSSSLSFYHDNIKTEISASPSSRIGVYVDHSAGTLSFYSVSDTMTLLHTVHTTFTQPLYAGFWVGSGSFVRLLDAK